MVSRIVEKRNDRPFAIGRCHLVAATYTVRSGIDKINMLNVAQCGQRNVCEHSVEVTAPQNNKNYA